MKAYRSGLEVKLGELLDRQSVPYEYETARFPYWTESRYTPDFFLPNGVIIEAKGFFKPSDRRKHLAVRDQHPELDIRFVFQRNNTISSKSKTTYGAWCDKHGFLWCLYPHLPAEWLT